MSHFSNFCIGDEVIVSHTVTGHEFSARLIEVYPRVPTSSASLS